MNGKSGSTSATGQREIISARAESCEAHTQGTGRVCKCCVQSAGRRGGSPVRLQLAEVLGAPCAMDSSAGDEVHHVGDARDEGHHGAGDERHLGHHGPSGRRHWPHRKRHAAPFCREPRPTKARVRQRGGLLTRPPSRGRERQLERRGAMLNATCRLVVRQRSVAMDPWIRWIRRPLAKHKTFSKVRPVRSCAPGRPNFEEFRPKVGKPQISIKISRNLDTGQSLGRRFTWRAGSPRRSAGTPGTLALPAPPAAAGARQALPRRLPPPTLSNPSYR